jgi:phospholipid transport system substrate-binding protein
MPTKSIVLISILILIPAVSLAQDPLEAVRNHIESGIRVLEDPRYADESRKAEQQKVLWEIMQQTYDFRVFSKKVLGSYWYRFSSRQRDDFIKVFSEFLGKFYLTKLQDRYSGQKVSYLRQQIINDNIALVEIEVSWKRIEVPLTLRVTKRSGKWKVYDLEVLGINAVSNYRAQFKSMLKKETPQQIIGRLKDKIAKLDAKSRPG